MSVGVVVGVVGPRDRVDRGAHVYRVGISGWAVAVAAAVLAGGCSGGGGASPSATPANNGEATKAGPDVAADAANALQQAGSVHLTGTELEDGKPGKVDLRLEGQNLSGTIGVEGQALDVVGIGSESYLKAPRSFWTAQKLPAQVVALLDNRWVKVPAAGADALINKISFTQIVDEIRKPPAGTIDPVVKPGTYNGQPTVVVTASDGPTLDVAAVGAPLPLHLLDSSKDGTDLAFTEIGVRMNITAPAGALDLGQLGG